MPRVMKVKVFCNTKDNCQGIDRDSDSHTDSNTDNNAKDNNNYNDDDASHKDTRCHSNFYKNSNGSSKANDGTDNIALKIFEMNRDFSIKVKEIKK